MEKKIIPITNTRYWYKIVEYLQENWAVIEPGKNKVTVYFFAGDGYPGTMVFDSMDFPDEASARQALRWNRFSPYDENDEDLDFLVKPQPPFYEHPHPNGRIYSSGRFWETPPHHKYPHTHEL